MLKSDRWRDCVPAVLNTGKATVMLDASFETLMYQRMIEIIRLPIVQRSVQPDLIDDG